MEDRIDLVDGAFWGRNPHDELTWLRENAPVWRDPHSGLWAVSTYDLVKQVATQPKRFSNAQGIRPDQGAVPSMIDSDDPEHLKRRKLVNKGFTPRRVRDQEDVDPPHDPGPAGRGRRARGVRPGSGRGRVGAAHHDR